MKKYFNLLKVFFAATLQAQLEYRANFLAQFTNALLTVGGSLFGLSLLLGDGNGVGGWNALEATAVVGVFTLLEGLAGIFLYPNLGKIAESVRTGSMDFTLLKPIDSQFLVSSRNLNAFRFPDVLIGLGLIVYSSVKLNVFTLEGFTLGLLLLVSAYFTVYALCFCLAASAFWFVKVENILELFWGFFRAGQFPITAFPAGGARLFFTFVIPVAFITTVPAGAFVGRVQLEDVLIALLVALGLMLGSRAFWSFALRSYTSASS